MAVNYNKLWELLAQKGMNRTELCRLAGITTNLLAKLGKNESVQAEVLGRICCALECGLDDIVDFNEQVTRYVHVPNVALSELESADEFARLGLFELYDFPRPISRISIKRYLTELCVSCKITRFASNELIEKLQTLGISIDISRSITPTPEMLPHEFIDDNEIEHTQIYNYISWAIENRTQETLDCSPKIAPSAVEEFDPIIEYGYVQIDAAQKGVTFAAEKQIVAKAEAAYPFNLLSTILEEHGSFYVFTHRLDELNALIQRLVDRLCPAEQFVLSAIYKKGLIGEELITYLGLPVWDSMRQFTRHFDSIDEFICFADFPYVQTAIAKIRRRLRYPKHSREFRQLITFRNPFANNVSEVYQSFVADLVENVGEHLKDGKELFEILSCFYPLPIVQQVNKEACAWYEIPNISIDDMSLDWQIYYALKKANILNLCQLWEKHGLYSSVDDLEGSGLNSVYGLIPMHVSELFNIMKEHGIGHIAPEKAKDIVLLAESLACKNESIPSIVCSAIPEKVLRELLGLQYRNISDVLFDYETGKLEKDIRLRTDGNICELSLQVIKELFENKIPIIHMNTFRYGYWFNNLNPEMTLQDIRHSYLHDMPIKGNPMDIEKSISCLFPGAPLEFVLTNQTHNQTMAWILWPPQIFSERVVLKDILHISDFESECIAFWGCSEEKCNVSYFLTKLIDEHTTSYYLYEFDGLTLNEIIGLDKTFLQCLFRSVQFNAELYRDPNGEGLLDKKFVQDQKSFCDVFSRIACNDEDKSVFNNFKPQFLHVIPVIQSM